ncbi:YfiR family protein [Pseudoalteromonas sp. SSDWG2]|uniref:YfiR family protein n=1 Tax=Pseudoalteromonas sp. SSDWG2 TaxID=3139391 RepID=UPI003BABBFBB
MSAYPIQSLANVDEYAVKTAFVYNFTKFVEWPSSQGRDESVFRVCVVGEQDILQRLGQLNDKVSRGRHIIVEQKVPYDTFDNCHIVYLASQPTSQVTELLARLANSPILTIGEYKGFASSHGIIEFHVDYENRVRLKINAERGRKNHLKLSAQLLEVAMLVMGNKV